MSNINAGNISVGRDFNIDSVINGTSEEKMQRLEDKIKTAQEGGDKTLVKQLVDMGFAISKKAGEFLVGKYLSGGF
jgi:uncharacterized membrane protein (DUF106 family)